MDAGERLYLLVIGDDIYATHALPPSGTVSIGRSPSCDVHVDHGSVSRRHARLDIAGKLAVADLGSANGTRVRGRRLAADEVADVQVGDIIDVGSVQLHLQSRAAPLKRKRVWSHDYFDARLIEECARAAAGGQPFAVLHVRTAREAPGDAVERALAAALRPFDTLASYAPGQYEILTCEISGDAAAVMVDQLHAELGQLGLTADIAVARYPDDGRDADSLISCAVHGSRDVENTVVRPSSPPGVDMQPQPLSGLVERIAQGNISVLILGETGVGKEVMARRIHHLSRRTGRPFLGLNCAALTETLLESQLFGHERGAFTDAISAKPGLLETADGGTVFLDEIGEMPASVQAKLLRVLEERSVLRVGGVQARPINVRFFAATNRDLEAEVAAGRFRQDLYFRLNGISLTIPPLRERVREIRDLAATFIEDAARADARTPPALSPAALAMLEVYSWPGNIRELRNTLERAILLCEEDVIRPDHLPAEKMRAARLAAVDQAASLDVSVGLDFARPQREQERARIIAAMTACGGNQTQAAKLLGIARRTLISKLELHGLPRPRKLR